MTNKTLNAISVGMQTLLGVGDKSFPLDYGNCFSLKTDVGKDYSIANFYLENLEFALESGFITYPIKILPLSERTAIIHDERIPYNWYRKDYCSTCCHESLFPEHQKLELERKILRGELVYKGEPGDEFRIQTTYMAKRPDWDMKKVCDHEYERIIYPPGTYYFKDIVPDLTAIPPTRFKTEQIVRRCEYCRHIDLSEVKKLDKPEPPETEYHINNRNFPVSEWDSLPWYKKLFYTLF